MKTYKIFTRNPVQEIEEVFTHKAIPFALETFVNRVGNENVFVPRQELLSNLPFISSIGMKVMRSRGQQNKQIYELVHGCVLAAFLNGIESNMQHDVCFPEDDSYDFLILAHKRGMAPDFKPLPNKEIYKDGVSFEVELTELKSLEDLERIIIDKSKYTKRILLVSIAFDGNINLQSIFDRISTANKSCFETIWLIGQTTQPDDQSKLCFLIAETVKYKKVFPLFELLVDWPRIIDEVNKATPHRV